MGSRLLGELGAVVVLGLSLISAQGGARKKPYRLPSVDIKQRVLWGAECPEPEGEGIAFGGQDQESADGRPHTRLLVDGQWQPIGEQLRRANALQRFHGLAWKLRDETKDVRAKARFLYFQGLSRSDEAQRLKEEVEPRLAKLTEGIARLIQSFGTLGGLDAYGQGQVRVAVGHLEAAAGGCVAFHTCGSVRSIQNLRAAQRHLELAAEALDAEPPPRALSPIVYDEATGLYVLFGGDHLDYLANDTWVLDPKARKWLQRHPPSAPAPRANHTLRVSAPGQITLSGGYTYASNTDYCGGQYLDLDDGEYIYDVKANVWRGAKLAPPDSRTYRTGPFHPDFYLQGDRPDAAAFEAWLKKLPDNEWVATNPPYRPRLNRDWGTAVIDTHRDLMLRWSGGHSAHPGTDVPHFHFATNRWELAYPIEFPLGQTYTNTSYPKGVNFNRRPGMTGHTYQSYAFDPVSTLMVQTGHPDRFYLYDPDRADWVGRGPKPKAMRYNSCFYTLTLCSTPSGIVCWTKDGKLLRYEHARGGWSPLETTGDRLPGAVVDNSTLAYDSARGRIVFFVKPYGKPPYDGRVWSLDLKTRQVTALTPTGAAGANRIAWIDRCCFHPRSGLVLFATYLKDIPDGWSPTPAYDIAGNRWVTLGLKYGGKKAWNGWRRHMPHGHSCGIMHDPRRRLLWGTDTNSQVYVLRLDAASAGVKPLGRAP